MFTQIGDDDTIFEDGILQALEMLEATAASGRGG